MPSRKEKCPTCGSTVKKQEYKSQIDGCDIDMIIMSLNNYLKSNAPREGKGLRYLSAIVTNNNSSKAVRKRNEYLTMDRIPPRVD